jgi:hypothetical protein
MLQSQQYFNNARMGVPGFRFIPETGQDLDD